MEATRSSLKTKRGDELSFFAWPRPAESEGAVRGVCLIVHGLGEHTLRYADLAAFLSRSGFDVRAFDQIGHGSSYGARGALPDSLRMLDDLADVVDHTRGLCPSAPLFLIGHSMGGLISSSFVSRAVRPVEGLILSCPALAPLLNAFDKILLCTIPFVLPGIRVSNGLSLEHLCRDPAVIAAYRADPLVHGLISARLARFLYDEGRAVQAAAPAWRVPTLLLWAGADRLVDPRACEAFAAAAPAAILQSRCYPAMMHEIFNDLEKGEVFARVLAWLAERAVPPAGVAVAVGAVAAGAVAASAAAAGVAVTGAAATAPLTTAPVPASASSALSAAVPPS